MENKFCDHCGEKWEESYFCEKCSNKVYEEEVSSPKLNWCGVGDEFEETTEIVHSGDVCNNCCNCNF